MNSIFLDKKKMKSPNNFFDLFIKVLSHYRQIPKQNI